mmetsp:Transcript_22087/g.32187  ORF Transcript_22087/g.32187 Transcript_22087/m.32187 type:complete len:272 (+) Transcript_22087:19-834(+)
MRTSKRPLQELNRNSVRSPPSKLTRIEKRIAVDKSAKKLRAAEFIDKAVQKEKLGDVSAALNFYEDAADCLPENTQLKEKVTELQKRFDESVVFTAANRVQKSKEMESTINNIISKRSRKRVTADQKKTSAETEMSQNDIDMPLDSTDYESLAPECSNEFEPRQSLLSTVSTESADSNMYSRDAMIENLQQKTVAALEYQLFDRLNNGDYDELLELNMIGPARAKYILEVRSEHESDAPFFTSLEQLEEIGMKPKQWQGFLKKNVLFLSGL